jgi:CHASE2 domain-containing sensor protein/anti-sigma regulatory factor (Ser/Thr protein kinase)
LLQRRLLIEWTAILVLATLLVIALSRGELTRRFDNLLYDRLIGLRAPPADDRILIVAIDNDSLRRIGRWPWGRETHAALLDRLAAAHPRAIAYDVLFTEPNPADPALAAAMTRAKPVFAPLLFETPGLNGADYDIIPPVPSVAATAAGVGHVNVALDSDGMVRSIALGAGRTRVPHLMELTYRAVTGHPSAASARMGTDGKMLIPFTHRAGAFRTVSFAAVLDGEVPAEFLRGRVVLIGATALGMGDAFPTPISGETVLPGVELQANVLNALLADRALAPLSPLPLTLLSLLPLWLLMLGFWRLNPAMGLRLSVALVLLCLVGAPAALLALGVWVPPGAAIVGLLLVYPLWGWRRLQALSDYVSGEVSRLRREPGLDLPARAVPAASDVVAAQAADLADAIERMRDLRRFVGDVIRELPDPLLVTDAGIVTLANSAAHALLGDDIVGRAKAPLSPLADGSLEIDGRCFILTRAALRDADDVQRGWIVRLADISAIRDAEREREALLEFLSHDMRSPQASILALIDHDGQSAVRPDIATRIRGYAHRTLTLADNFVQLARVSATPFRPEPVSLGDVLAEAADDLWTQADRRGIRIVCAEADEEHLMLGEGAELLRALINLLDNAVRFTPDGGTVRAGIGRDGGMLVCTISDQGPGIAPERLSTLFQRFAVAAEKGRSAGLGLAYVKAVIDRHHGEISCDSDSGGTRFTLRFAAID